MPHRVPSPLALTILALALVFPVPASFAASDEWKPATAEELALKTSLLEPEADAEALLWDVRVADRADEAGVRTVLDHHVRIKIFNERGVSSQGTVTIPYSKGTSIQEIRGRTIRPDGSIVPLPKDAVFDRSVVKLGGERVRNKTIAMPAVVPGAIVEYRYREVRGDAISHYLRFYFQRDVPVRKVVYHVHPLEVPGYVMKARSYHGATAAFRPEGDGFFVATAEYVRSYREEPYMPPEDQVRMWTLVYYAEETEPAAESFWKDLGREVDAEFRDVAQPSREVKAAALEAVGDATDPEVKLERIFRWVRRSVRNSGDPLVPMTERDRDRARKNRKASQTLQRGVGNGYDIDVLFASMAMAAGFETRYAALSNRDDLAFDPGWANAYFLRSYAVAVRVGEGWRFFDPGSAHAPWGMLLWNEEGVTALVCDKETPGFTETPVAPPDRSTVRRVGRFRLDAEGTLEGDVRIERSGHAAVDERSDVLEQAEGERAKSVAASVAEAMGTADVTNVGFEGLADHEAAFTVTYHVRAPGYAQKTGRHLLLQPGVFQKGDKPPFSATARKFPVSFRYAWSEVDSVVITLPDGYVLDRPEAPAPLRAPDLSLLSSTLSVSPDGGTLTWARSYAFGTGGVVRFPVQSYADLKKLFELQAEHDAHTVALDPVASK